MIVKMIIHPPSCAAVTFVFRRDFAEIAKVIVSEQDRNVIQNIPVLQPFHPGSAIPVLLNFLINGQNLRRMFKIVFLQ
ncbi:hypothetical protein D3C76_934030 [compost metagenome]